MLMDLTGGFGARGIVIFLRHFRADREDVAQQERARFETMRRSGELNEILARMRLE